MRQRKSPQWSEPLPLLRAEGTRSRLRFDNYCTAIVAALLTSDPPAGTTPMGTLLPVGAAGFP